MCVCVSPVFVCPVYVCPMCVCVGGGGVLSVLLCACLSICQCEYLHVLKSNLKTLFYKNCSLGSVKNPSNN